MSDTGKHQKAIEILGSALLISFSVMLFISFLIAYGLTCTFQDF